MKTLYIHACARALLVALLVSVGFAANAQMSIPDRQIVVLCKSAVASSIANSANEEVLATCSVPAGAMGPNGVLRATAVWTVTNSGNSKTFRGRFGGASGTIYGSAAASSIVTFRQQFIVANRGVANSQVGTDGGTGGWSTTTSANITSTVDTTAATSIVFSCQKATGSETCTLESFLVELMYGS